MSNIDTSSWKDFKVCDIFLCETTKGIPSKNDLEVGDIPYITRSSENNGRAQTCGNINNIVKGNCITIGAEGFTAFYQKDDFVAGNKVYSLRIKNYEMNEILGLYLASELNSFTENYSFNNARILEKIKKETIKLPVTETYEPDWQYMEEYMKNIESEVTSKIDKFQMILGNEKHKIDTQKWGGYRIGDLFDIERGKVKGLQQKETGIVPVIAAARQNQGIAGFYNVEPLFENKITISCNGAGCGSTFYHPYKFNINGDAIVLSEKMEISDSVKQFIACILDATFIKKYSYEEKCSADKAKNEVIKLPTTVDGRPDWDYMEKYTKDIENKVIHYIDSIEDAQ